MCRYLNNPYHCSTHAAAVLQSLHVLLTCGAVLDAVLGAYASRELLLLGAYLAAIVHDYGHLGVTNRFLVEVGVYLSCLPSSLTFAAV